MAENIPARARRNPVRTPPAPVRVLEAPEAPAHLSMEAKTIWTGIASEWVLDASAVLVLRAALEAFDLAQRARQDLAADGPTFTTETGLIRQHPAAKIMVDGLREFRAGLRQLGLSVD